MSNHPTHYRRSNTNDGNNSSSTYRRTNTNDDHNSSNTFDPFNPAFDPNYPDTFNPNYPVTIPPVQFHDPVPNNWRLTVADWDLNELSETPNTRFINMPNNIDTTGQNFWPPDAGFQQQQPLPPFNPLNTQDAVVAQEPARPVSRSTEPVPIPPFRRTDQAVASTTAASGPMSADVVVPKRPKPGRKPLPTEQSQDRRRVQNRIAQRNFRDKRQQKLAETLAELKETKEKFQEKISEMERQHAKKVRTMQLEIDRLKEHNTEMEQSLQRFRDSQSVAPSSSVVPSVEPQLPSPGRRPRRMGPVGYSSDSSPRERETDFTTYGKKRPVAAAMRPSLSSHSNFSMTTMDGNEGHCGFCTDDSNCACKQTSSMQNTFGAGNCQSCQQDPNRKRACIELARQASDEANVLAPMIDCSTFMDQVAAGGRLGSISHMVDRGQIAVAHSTTTGFRIAEREAAQALHELSSMPSASTFKH